MKNQTAHDPYRIVPLAAFRDNYIWLLHRGARAAVVDPGEAAPVLARLAADGLQLCAILATHHHADHVGGIAELRARFPEVPVYGPVAEAIDGVTVPLRDGDRLELPFLAAGFDVLAVPGHTRGHLAYYDRNHLDCGALFCGDTLFSAGCGRLFEGTPRDMQGSLVRLRALPGVTKIYCAHEYTEANLRFALAVEPDNAELHAYVAQVAELRAAGRLSLPSTLAQERLINPFLRWDAPAVIAAAARFRGHPVSGPIEVFAAIREWKNGF